MVKIIDQQEEDIKAKRKELSLFLHNVRRSGEYPEHVLERLDAHLMESEPSTIIDSINHDEARWTKDQMYEILLKFALGYHYA